MPNGERRSIMVVFPTVEPILTYALLFILVAIFLYAQSLSPLAYNEFQLRWMKVNSDIGNGEYYRLFTSMFLHLNIAHIGLNAFALYLFGREVETLYGHARFLIIYILGGLAGSYASYLYTDAPSLGASGAIFAIFSATGVYIYHHRRIYGRYASQRLQQLATLAVLNIFIGFTPGARTDNAAHIGGLIGGFILAWFMSPALVPQQRSDGNIELVDKNTPDQWWFVPLIFGVGLAAALILTASRA